ncbi:MAG TPA: zinc-ribbon domain-containing protein [Gemmatimonadaceae bacterium]|nr:zinc-ribbon domain-containing protein [Gemmatimonadaceae bacterium]
MNVSCPDCRSIFRVDPSKVPPSGVRARCSVCGGVISIPAPTGQNTPPTGIPQAGGSSTPSGNQPRQRATPQASDSWDPAPFSSSTPRTPAPAAPPPRPASPPPAPPPPRTMEAPAAPRPRPEAVERATAAATATPPSPTSGLPEFATPPAAPSFPSPASSPFPAPSAPPFVPGASRPPTPSRTLGPPPSPVSPASSDGGARRPLNPFLSKDPNQRAKRLARALVSDIITYHPAKHAEGLRDGTLKQLFREEIKKSFEEYIAQVGQQLAESTTYFQEALNEVLGAGKKIF